MLSISCPLRLPLFLLSRSDQSTADLLVRLHSRRLSPQSFLRVVSARLVVPCGKPGEPRGSEGPIPDFKLFAYIDPAVLEILKAQLPSLRSPGEPPSEGAFPLSGRLPGLDLLKALLESVRAARDPSAEEPRESAKALARLLRALVEADPRAAHVAPGLLQALFSAAFENRCFSFLQSLVGAVSESLEGYLLPLRGFRARV